MLPFTPRRKDNLAAWLVARSDPAHYGDVRVFQFPKQKVVFGPRQVVARINQDQMISPQITLWNQQGSQVTWGTQIVMEQTFETALARLFWGTAPPRVQPSVTSTSNQTGAPAPSPAPAVATS